MDLRPLAYRRSGRARSRTTRRGRSSDDLQSLSEAGFLPTTEGGAAAVWENDPAVGERIEFLIRHQGTARQIGQTTMVAGQPGVGAIALTDMDIMMNHTTTLRVPITGDRNADTLTVRVPLLGAYITTKAATFVKRRPTIENEITTANPKAAKDLVYVRDLMAAGDEVTDRITAEIEGLRKHSKGNREYLGIAEARLTDVLRSDPRGVIELAAREIAERDRVTAGVARADMIGHLHGLQRDAPRLAHAHDRLCDLLNTMAPEARATRWYGRLAEKRNTEWF